MALLLAGWRNAAMDKGEAEFAAVRRAHNDSNRAGVTQRTQKKQGCADASTQFTRIESLEQCVRSQLLKKDPIPVAEALEATGGLASRASASVYAAFSLGPE